MAAVQVVGLTARGWLDLPEQQRAIIERAEVLLGGSRHLALVPSLGGQERVPWPSPLREGLPALLARYEGRRVVALASGDPLLSGVGSTLVQLLGAPQVEIHPAVSSVALARARLGWSAEESDVVTVVGRDLDRVRRRLAPQVRLIILSGGADTPQALAELLVHAGYGDSRMVVLGDLGSDHEQRLEGTAVGWHLTSPALNVVGVDCALSEGAVPHGWSAGLPDEAFEHDGQLTKRDLRASALGRLSPQPGQLLWDLGAGAGSIAIEWLRCDARCRAIAVEQNPERTQRIARNAARLGVPDLQVVATTSADALDWLPEPDAIFLGGGADQDVVRRCWHLLRPRGRLVAHAVTLETETVLTTAYRTWGGELTRIAVETAGPLGGYLGWQPSRAVVQWSVTKPDSSQASR